MLLAQPAICVMWAHGGAAAALLCRWDLAGSSSEFTVDKGWGATWVKVVASWLCAGLYVWTMVAHRMLSSRSFY